MSKRSQAFGKIRLFRIPYDHLAGLKEFPRLSAP
jgi:hypothetical protein